MPEDPPIPTYEEAVAGSSFTDRDRLLGNTSNYQPPTVESARSSLSIHTRDDSDDEDGPGYTRASHRADITQFDLEDPLYEQQKPSRLRDIQMRLTHIKDSLSERISAFTPFRNISLQVWTPKLPDIFTNPAYVPLWRLFGVVFVMVLVYSLMAADLFTVRRAPVAPGTYPREDIRTFALRNIDGEKVRQFAEYISSFDHVAGTAGDYQLAKYVEGYFSSFMLDNVWQDKYEVFLSYPEEKGRSISIVEPENLKWEADLEEEIPNEKFSEEKHTPVFHAFSKSGDVTGHLMYANDGTDADFAKLKELGLETKGSIMMIRASGNRGDTAWKIRAAENAGAVGVIIFIDSRANSYFDSRHVQRDSVALGTHVVGDILTPGYASTMEAPRIAVNESEALPSIPSLPINAGNAEHLLRTLKGHGKRMDKSWGTVGTPIEWWSGDKTSPKVRLQNHLKEVPRQSIWNVFGQIQGYEQPSKKIIIGNHRDSWCFGAADASSGTAILLEVARLFGELMKKGWRPARTIIFASWDGGAFNNIGSTEFVEERAKDLRQNGVAYINLGAAVTGRQFTARGNPALERVLREVLGRVKDFATRKRLSELFPEDPIPPLGGAGDFVAFQSHVGVSSIDISFTGTPYPKNSCLDTADLMKQIDYRYRYHEVMAKVAVSLVLELADLPVLPFQLSHYADQVWTHARELEWWSRSLSRKDLDYTPLLNAAKEMGRTTRVFEDAERGWRTSDEGFMETAMSAVRRQSHNSRMSNFEHHLLELDGGVDGRKWFRNVMWAPLMNDSSQAAVFPLIRDAIMKGEPANVVQKAINRSAAVLSNASKKLIGN